ncbi:hypothetical protein NP233_g11232 [Leucocoprinus birnbaumii]|uniref:F-box domain-containing protein n=1 Tax=Leucocoprinus birnbaumii TaxID=56174 RepID=A0AAD5YKL6_9AGAR|nr:hypothetical protein NP233_g11232 [Leucocoprinus birnbaumii]
MPSLFDSLKHLLSSFITGTAYEEYSRQYPSCFFLRVPLLVYLDHVFPCLAVEDVICLRRVNKAFYLITHEPSIWLRFLSRMNHHPVIYLRPTFDYTNPDTYYEAEQLVTRTISLDDNWRDSNSKVITRMLFETHYEVLEMSLLPGGKYMIASVKDKSSYRYYLMLYILDHPSGPAAIARIPTHAKTFHLQTRYMKYNGTWGIVITCTRRRFANGGPLNINLSELSHEHPVDVPPYFTEVLVYFTSMEVLEEISDPNLVWGSPEHIQKVQAHPGGPFRLCTTLEVAEGEIQDIATFDNDGTPWIAVVTRDTYISFFSCGPQRQIILKCADHPGFWAQTIKGILPLPKQKQILVVRQCIELENEEWAIELYDFPTEHAIQTPTHYIIVRSDLPPDSLLKVRISEPLFFEPSPNFPKLQTQPLPPLSIYFESRNPYGLMHYSLWPMYEPTADGGVKYIPKYIVDPTPPANGTTPEWAYERDVARTHYAHQTCHVTDPQVVHILPGNYRAVYYTTSEDDRRASPSIMRLRRYHSPETQKIEYPVRPEDNSSAFMRTERPYLPSGLYGTIDIKPQDDDVFSKGVNAVAWDESIGRICIAVEGELGIRILDMAMNVEPDNRFAGWKQQMSQEIVEQDCWHTKDCIHSRSIPGWWEHWFGSRRRQ